MNPTPYRHAADRIVSRIAVPVLREPVFFCFMLLTFVWPQLTSDLFRIEATHWEILGLYIAYAYAATLPLGILGGKARRWYKTAAYTLAYAVSMAECFLLVFFRTFITPSLMSIATDTKAPNSSGATSSPDASHSSSRLGASSQASTSCWKRFRRPGAPHRCPMPACAPAC